jgi:acyl dehydratase
MPLSSAIAGARSEPVTAEIDPRWTMAYAAALGDFLPCYMDTTRPDRLLAHPLFPVCFEWPVITGMRGSFRDSTLTRDEAVRGVHATHDILLHRPIRSPERLTTRLTIAGIERRTPGAFQLSRLDTVDSNGAPVCTSWYGTIYRGVGIDGADLPAKDAPPVPERRASTPARAEFAISISAGLAHVYTECARIFNPIHTDAAVAKSVGLPAIILHGTATLALAVSRIIEAEAGGDPARVARVAGRFSAMVLMPSQVTVRIFAREDANIFFDVLSAEGKPAVRDGLVALRA